MTQSTSSLGLELATFNGKSFALAAGEITEYNITSLKEAGETVESLGYVHVATYGSEQSTSLYVFHYEQAEHLDHSLSSYDYVAVLFFPSGRAEELFFCHTVLDLSNLVGELTPLLRLSMATVEFNEQG